MKSAHGKSSHGESGSNLTRSLSDAVTIGAQVRRAVESAHSSRAFVSPESEATLFRIYTEDFPVVGLVSKYFQGATLFHPTGIWNGNVESALIIEIVGSFSDRNNVVALAADIALANKQEVVMVTWQNARTFDRVNVFGESTVSH